MKSSNCNSSFLTQNYSGFRGLGVSGNLSSHASLSSVVGELRASSFVRRVTKRSTLTPKLLGTRIVGSVLCSSLSLFLQLIQWKQGWGRSKSQQQYQPVTLYREESAPCASQLQPGWASVVFLFSQTVVSSWTLLFSTFWSNTHKRVLRTKPELAMAIAAGELLLFSGRGGRTDRQVPK